MSTRASRSGSYGKHVNARSQFRCTTFAIFLADSIDWIFFIGTSNTTYGILSQFVKDILSERLISGCSKSVVSESKVIFQIWPLPLGSVHH